MQSTYETCQMYHNGRRAFQMDSSRFHVCTHITSKSNTVTLFRYLHKRLTFLFNLNYDCWLNWYDVRSIFYASNTGWPTRISNAVRYLEFRPTIRFLLIKHLWNIFKWEEGIVNLDKKFSNNISLLLQNVMLTLDLYLNPEKNYKLFLFFWLVEINSNRSMAVTIPTGISTFTPPTSAILYLVNKLWQYIQ